MEIGRYSRWLCICRSPITSKYYAYGANSGANVAGAAGGMADTQAVNGHGLAGINTVAADIALPAEPKPARRGRPAGSKNKVGADAKALLAEHGLAGVRALCNIAAGRAVYRPLKGGGRERLVPELSDMIAAQKAILSRLVPELKAQEITGKDGEPLMGRGISPGDPNYNRELAKAATTILDSFRRSIPGANFAITEPGEASVTFSDPDLAKRVFPDGGHTPTASPADRASESPKPATDADVTRDADGVVVVGGRVALKFVEDRDKWVLCRVGDATPLEYRRTFPEAVARARELIERKKL